MKLLLALVLLAGLVAVAGCRAAPEPAPKPPKSAAGLENGSFLAKLDGAGIHFEVRGTGPVLMTLPNSWGLSLEGLRAMYRPLESQLTMVYFDPRGMGESQPVREETDMSMEAVRRDFVALARHLGLEKVNAIGWSNGAMNLIYLAAENPGLIENAIFLHGVASWGPEDVEQVLERHPELADKWIAFERKLASSDATPDEKTAMLREFSLTTSFPAMIADASRSLELVGAVFQDAEFSWRHQDYNNRSTPGFDARDQLGKIAARCLVIAGAHDLAPPEKVRVLSDGLPHSEFVVLENSGHFSPVEEPGRFRETVLRFLGVAPISP